MNRLAAYSGLAALAVLPACGMQADGSAPLADMPLAEKLEPRRFTHDGTVYLVDLRERRMPLRPDGSGLTPRIGVVGYDIAVSRDARQFQPVYGDRAEAANAAAAYCAALGGIHDDGAAGVFYGAGDGGGNAEWLFPGWCPLQSVGGRT